MMMCRLNSRIAVALFAAAWGGLSTGCSLFEEQLSPQLMAQITPNGVEDGKLETPPANFTVECRPEGGKPIAKEQPLVGTLNVQEALEHTRANQKYRKFTLRLHRPLPDGRLHQMVLEYDRKEKRVAPEFDYSILPGDQLIVIEDTSTVFDEMLDAMAAPFGGSLKKKDSAKDRFRMEG
ncbi:MAG: hypothetical protein WD872_11780 [Pirellulaceae bacterium]